jgi:hypothetical protein
MFAGSVLDFGVDIVAILRSASEQVLKWGRGGRQIDM